MHRKPVVLTVINPKRGAIVSGGAASRVVMNGSGDGNIAGANKRVHRTPVLSQHNSQSALQPRTQTDGTGKGTPVAGGGIRGHNSQVVRNDSFPPTSSNPPSKKKKSDWSPPKNNYFDQMNASSEYTDQNAFDDYNEELHNMQYESAEVNEYEMVPQYVEEVENIDDVHTELEKASNIVAGLREKVDAHFASIKECALNQKRSEDHLNRMQAEISFLHTRCQSKQRAAVERTLRFNVTKVPNTETVIYVHPDRTVTVNFHQLCSSIPVKSLIRYNEAIDAFAYLSLGQILGDDWEIVSLNPKHGEVQIDRGIIETLKNVAFTACGGNNTTDHAVSEILTQRVKRIDEVFKEEGNRRRLHRRAIETNEEPEGSLDYET